MEADTLKGDRFGREGGRGDGRFRQFGWASFWGMKCRICLLLGDLGRLIKYVLDKLGVGRRSDILDILS